MTQGWMTNEPKVSEKTKYIKCGKYVWKENIPFLILHIYYRNVCKKYRTRYLQCTLDNWMKKTLGKWSLNNAALLWLPGSGGHGPPNLLQRMMGNQLKTRLLHLRSSAQLTYKTPDAQVNEKTKYRWPPTPKLCYMLNQIDLWTLGEDLQSLQWCIDWHLIYSNSNSLLSFYTTGTESCATAEQQMKLLQSFTENKESHNDCNVFPLKSKEKAKSAEL